MSGESLVPAITMGLLWGAAVGLTKLHDYLRLNLNSKGVPRKVNKDRWIRAMDVRDIRLRRQYGLKNLNRPLIEG